MDKLTDVLNRYSFSAKVFFSGLLCGDQPVMHEQGEGKGFLHLLKSGTITIIDGGSREVVVEKPSVIFFPHATAHKFIVQESANAELVCADIGYEGGLSHPLTSALPKLLYLELQEGSLLEQTAQWLFEEAFQQRCGRQPMIDRLCDVLMIQLLRHVLDQGLVTHGTLAGLSHPQLAKAMTAIHRNPEKPWTLNSMAEIAAMSRSKFAEEFRLTVGQTPADYLMNWRIFVAQGLLKKNQSVGLVAHSVGYENGSALARAFRKKTGLSPRDWLKKIGKK